MSIYVLYSSKASIIAFSLVFQLVTLLPHAWCAPIYHYVTLRWLSYLIYRERKPITRPTISEVRDNLARVIPKDKLR